MVKEASVNAKDAEVQRIQEDINDFQGDWNLEF